MQQKQTVIDTPTAEIHAVFERLQANTLAVGRSSVESRLDLLAALGEMVQKHTDEIVDAMRIDLGRQPADTLGELLMVKTEIDFARKNLRSWLKPQKIKGNTLSFGTRATIVREPLGCGLILSTWNAPFVIGLVPVVGLISGGNTGILKPSEVGPACSHLLADLLGQYLPNDHIAVVEGGVETAQALLELPFDHIAYTGNPEVGRVIMAAASHHLASVTLEMGGKNPAIVLPSADVPDTAAKLIWGRFSNCGQACVAPDYVLVHESIADQLIEELSTAVVRMYDPDGQGIQNGSYNRMVNQRHFQRVVGLLEDAQNKGAEVIFGGDHDAADRYIEPTLLRGVTDDMRVMKEEIFGPLLPIISWRDEAELYSTVRQHSKPLALYIFSTDKTATQRVVAETRAGSTVINHNLIQAGMNSNLPFGGVNSSGMGRLVGKATFDSFTNPRSVVEQKRGLFDISSMSLPPYGDRYEKMLRWLLGRGA